MTVANRVSIAARPRLPRVSATLRRIASLAATFSSTSAGTLTVYRSEKMKQPSIMPNMPRTTPIPVIAAPAVPPTANAKPAEVMNTSTMPTAKIPSSRTPIRINNHINRPTCPRIRP